MFPRRWLVVVLLVLQAGLLVPIGWVYSPVYNEEGHLASGIIHLRIGEFSACRVNPPLIRSVAALPLVFEHNSKLIETFGIAGAFPHQRWEYAAGRYFLEENKSHWIQYLRTARSTCLIFAMAGLLCCYHWSRQCYGGFCGITAATLWLVSPYILGHGATLMPDVPSAALGVAAVYSFWRWLKHPAWLEIVVAGVVLGLAELCKFTLLILYPLLPIIWLAYRIPEWRAHALTWHNWLRQASMLIVLFLTSIFVINCGYVFEGTFTPLEEFRFQTTMFTGLESLDEVPPDGANRFTGTWLGSLPIPLPANMVQGIDTQRYDFERGLPSYLYGTWQDHGWWYYYLYALAIKTPLGTWLLIIMALGVTIFERNYNVAWRDEMVVIVPGLAIFIFVSSQTGFSVHSRYVIPAMPFLFIWASKVVRVFRMQPLNRKQLTIATICVIAITWSVASSLWVYPHSLSYFNELVGGPRGGPRHLLGSNVDWGQDLFYLKRWLMEHPEVQLDGMAYQGSLPVALSGISPAPHPTPGPIHTNGRFSGLDDQLGPKPGWYALSVNHLYDRMGRYNYFLRLKPVAMAGYSIYIYHVTLDKANRLRREFGLSELPAADWHLDIQSSSG